MKIKHLFVYLFGFFSPLGANKQTNKQTDRQQHQQRQQQQKTTYFETAGPFKRKCHVKYIQIWNRVSSVGS